MVEQFSVVDFEPIRGLKSEDECYQVMVSEYESLLVNNKLWPANGDPDHWRKEIDPLRGLDLICYCPLTRPCHADVLLSYANA